MCHQVTCNVEFNCKLVHFILYKHPQLDTLLNFLFSEQYSFYSTNSHYLKKEMHIELIVCLCSVKVVASPNVGHHGLSPPISVHCSSEFVLMKKFICSLMDACTVSTFPENMKASGKSNDVFFKCFRSTSVEFKNYF